MALGNQALASKESNTMTQSERIADAYCETLAAWLDEKQLQSVTSGQAWPDDYCDTNMAMESAFKRLGVPLWNDADDAVLDDAIDIWNEAGAIAAARRFKV
jgi:hypothetical protein